MINNVEQKIEDIASAILDAAEDVDKEVSSVAGEVANIVALKDIPVYNGEVE